MHTIKTYIHEFDDDITIRKSYTYYIDEGQTVISWTDVEKSKWHRPTEEGPAHEVHGLTHKKYNTATKKYENVEPYPYDFILYVEFDEVHRYDGPARSENYLGELEEKWYIRGRFVGHNDDVQDYLDWTKECGFDLSNLAPEDKVLIDMKWGKQ